MKLEYWMLLTGLSLSISGRLLVTDAETTTRLRVAFALVSTAYLITGIAIGRMQR